MNFSTNQVRQIYVVNSYSANAVTDSSAVGALSVHGNSYGDLYFLHRGVDGVSRSDLIKNIDYARATDADELARPLKKYTVTLDASVNSGNVIAGEDYILRLTFRNYIGLSEEDQYFKHAAVRGTSGMTASQFYAKLALSLAKNLSREPSKLLKVYVRTSNGDTEVTVDTLETSLTGTYTAVVIEEVEQEWSLGTFESLEVNFQIQPTTVDVSGEDLIWGLVTPITPTTLVQNGKVTADLEYFLMGERGDEYRMVGFPKVIKTDYLVNPANAYNYLDIHYSFLDSGENYYKSEKDITLVFPKVGTDNSVSNALANSVITAINSAASLSIPDLDDTDPDDTDPDA